MIEKYTYDLNASNFIPGTPKSLWREVRSLEILTPEIEVEISSVCTFWEIKKNLNLP